MAGPTAPILVQTAPVVSLTTAATSIAGTFGSAPTAGNLMVAIFGGRGGTGVTITPPSGWTQITRLDNSTTSFIAAYQKVVATGDGTSYTFGLGGTARFANLILVEISGQSPGTTVNVSNTYLASASSAPSTPSVTPTNTNVLYLAGFLSIATNGVVSSVKAGWTEVGKAGNASNTTTLEVQRMAEGTDVTAQGGQVTWSASTTTCDCIIAINPSVVNDAFSRYMVKLAGLQAYYRLDDTSFAKANDTWGNNGGGWQNTTSVTLNQPGLVTGGADAAAVLSSAGNGGCIAMPTALGPTGTNAFTWIVLCKPTNSAANNQRLIGNDSWTSPGPNKGATLIISGNGQLQTWRATDGLQSTSYIPNLVGFYHLVAVTYDALALRLYCDGVCVFSTSDTTSITTNGPNFLIGAAGAFGSNFDGTMDEVAILNAAVPGEAIADLWRLAQNNIPAANPQLTYGAYYNDGAGGWDANPTVKWPAFVSKATNAGAAPNHVPKIAHFFQNWAGDTVLDAAAANQAVTSGAQPLLTWESWNPGGGTGGNSADQPTYSLNNIANGNFNSYIDTFAASIASWGRPIFVRIFHEYNDKIYPWSLQPDNQGDYPVQNTAALFVSAWHLIVDRCKAQGATNIRWVWCLNRHYNYSGNGSFDSTSYPGDTYVDYAAFDMYNQLFSGAWEYPFDCGALVYSQIVSITSKPVLICEFGANPDADGGTAVAWINDFLGTVVPTYLPKVVAVVMESDASASHANWGIDATAGTLAAYQAQYAASLYGGAALLPVSTTYTQTLAAGLSPVGAPTRAVGALRSAVEGMTASRLRALARQVGATLGSAAQVARNAGKARTAASSPGGSRGLLDARALAASVQTAGARLRSVSLSRTGAVSPVAGAVRAVAWLRSAALGTVGATAVARQRLLALAASLSPVGQRLSTAGLVRAATAAMGGARQQAVSWRRAATDAATGTIGRALSLSRTAQPAITAARTRTTSLPRAATEALQGGRILAAAVVRSASLGTSGALVRIRQVLRSFVASLGPTGGRQQALSVLRSALVSPTGLAARVAQLVRGATLAAGGSAQVLRAKILDFLASVSPVAGGTRATGLPRQATLALTGARARAVSLARSAALGLSGVLGTIKAKTLTLVASVSPAGARAAVVGTVRFAVQTATATLRRATARAWSGTLAASGASGVGRAFVRAFSALFQPQASRQEAIQSHRIGTFSLAASTSRSAARGFVGQETPTAGVATSRAWLRSFVAAVGPGGALARVRRLTLVLQATDRAAVVLARAEAKSETASARFAGAAAVNRLKLLFLSAVVGLLGALTTGSSQRTATVILWDVTPVTVITTEVQTLP